MSNREQNRSTSSNRDSIGIPAGFSSGDRPGFAMPTGVYVGKVVEAADGDFGGSIYVQIVNSQKWGSTDTREDRQKFTKVRTVSPFGGSITSADATVTYGASFPPPAHWY